MKGEGELSFHKGGIGFRREFASIWLSDSQQAKCKNFNGNCRYSPEMIILSAFSIGIFARR